MQIQVLTLLEKKTRNNVLLNIKHYTSIPTKLDSLNYLHMHLMKIKFYHNMENHKYLILLIFINFVLLIKLKILIL